MQFDLSATQVVVLLAIGVAAGILSGLVGVGGGIVVVPALVLLLGMTQLSAQGTSLVLFQLPFGILGLLKYHRTGNVNWLYGVVIGLGLVMGSYLGARWASQVDQNLLRKGFALFMVAVAVKLFLGK